MALTTLGKVTYSVTFLVLVPVALVAWAAATAGVVDLPVIRSLPIGVSIAAVGLVLVLLGMRDLWVHGGGLPMNADPPPRYVARGSYGLLPHPIYTGFSLLCVGVSIVAGSASGLWMVSPVVMLGCAALVVGYEHQDLRARFGAVEGGILPLDDASAPSLTERLRCCLIVVLPWAILLVASQASQLWLGDIRFRYFYAVVLTVFFLGPFSALTRRELRGFAVRGTVAMLAAFVLFLGLPLIAPEWAFRAHSWVSGVIFLPPTPWVYVPSVGIICAFLAAEGLADRWRSWRWFFRCAAMAAAVCLVLTGRSGLLCALSAMLAVYVASHSEVVWETIRGSAECLANSWHEWRLGPVRIINHGVYAGMGGALALWLACVLAGPGHLAAILVTATSAVVGAALWAQYVEGSPQLLRPYGFYGGLLGGTLGAMAGPLFHTSAWLVLAVFSAGGPWAQALGRLRCLVQGCCHGAPASSVVGIRYVHPRSRVSRMTPWADVPLQPTPLYSILWNGLVGLLLIRLWSVHAAISVVIGLYFILNGIGRFAEEGWRGEPQTSVVAGLRLYQWAAVASVVLGGVFSVVATGTPAPSPQFSWSPVLPAAVFGLVVACAMGVDFPESDRRFSRLA
jgi:prolipoprotein diacylglyceryltransferase